MAHGTVNGAAMLCCLPGTLQNLDSGHWTKYGLWCGLMSIELRPLHMQIGGRRAYAVRLAIEALHTIANQVTIRYKQVCILYACIHMASSHRLWNVTNLPDNSPTCSSTF